MRKKMNNFTISPPKIVEGIRNRLGNIGKLSFLSSQNTNTLIFSNILLSCRVHASMSFQPVINYCRL